MAKHTNYSPTFPMFPGGAVAVTPSDTALLTYTSVIYVGTAGNVKVLTAQNDTTTFIGLQPGQVIPVQVVQVFSTGTTATNLVAVY